MNERISSGVLVEPLTDRHADAMLAIQQAGSDEGNAIFEIQLPAWAAFSAARLPGHRLVATDRKLVVGWVAVAAVSRSRVYGRVVEHSVYVDPRARGRDVGRTLLDAMIAATKSAGIWTIQPGSFPENVASLRLHWSAGFRQVGVRERLARHHGGWRDGVLLQR
jgi:L-amino acid N-acyltransferase YncA